jgi:RNA polymerase sigma-70 factor (ECF subfamily)
MRRRSVTEETDRIGALYLAEGERLWRAVYAFSSDREITDDAVAEAFAQCLRRGTEVRDPKPWVWRAAFRIAAGELKERGRWAGFPPEAVIAEPEPPGPLLTALRSLPRNQRATLILRHYGGYDAGEIADALGIGRATVRVHLSRGRRRLRQILEADDGEP